MGITYKLDDHVYTLGPRFSWNLVSGKYNQCSFPDQIKIEMDAAQADRRRLIVPPKKVLKKVFFIPFESEKYYESASYYDVFSIVQKHIRNHIYFYAGSFWQEVPYPFDDLESTEKWLRAWADGDKHNTTSLMENCLDAFPELLLDDNYENLPIRKFIIFELGQLFYLARHHGDPRQVEKAKSDISRLMERPSDRKWKKKNVPPSLYLQAFREYLHEITKYLKSKYSDYDPADTSRHLSKIDKRLVAIYKAGLLKKLCGRDYHYVTDHFLSEFFCKKVGGLRQDVKEETAFIKRLPMQCTPVKR